jgi:hypothetical protein
MNDFLILDEVDLLDTATQVLRKAAANSLGAVDGISGRHVVNGGVLCLLKVRLNCNNEDD